MKADRNRPASGGSLIRPISLKGFEPNMKISKKKLLLSLVALLVFGIVAAMLWMKSETERSKKLMQEFNDQIQSGKLKPINNSLKLHIGNFMLVKTQRDIYALKITELKSSVLFHDWDEASFECYSYGQDEHARKFTLERKGKVRQYFQKVSRDNYRIDSARSDKLECGDISFDPWSYGDEDNTAWVIVTKKNGETRDIQYTFTTSKEIGSLDVTALTWNKIKSEN